MHELCRPCQKYRSAPGLCQHSRQQAEQWPEGSKGQRLGRVGLIYVDLRERNEGASHYKLEPSPIKEGN
jgi:hypothetical protein